MDLRLVVAALADLAPARPRPGVVYNVARDERSFRWLAGRIDAMPRSAVADRLAALDALRHDERLLRRGHLFVIGSTVISGRHRTIRLPLLSQPVRLRTDGAGYAIVPAGDVEIHPLVERTDEPDLAGDSMATRTWLRSAAASADLPVEEVWKTSDVVRRQPPTRRLVGAVAAAVYLDRGDSGSGLTFSATLMAWLDRSDLHDTALAEMLAAAPAQPVTVPPVRHIRSPLPLTAAQREVVHRARTEPVVVVSGPPGNGKSHAVAAVAIDAVDRGCSVLVATQSPHAADVLGDLLRRYPGPVPVLFGDAERREAIATELAATPAGAGDSEISVAEARAREATAALDRLEHTITAALDLEQRAAAADRWDAILPSLAVDMPGVLAPELDVTRAERLLARTTGTGWFGRWRARRAERKLRALLSAGPVVDVDRLRRAIEAAGARQAAARLVTMGGTDLAALWSALAAADKAAADGIGTAMRLRAASARRWRNAGRRSAATLATALRSGREHRRMMLTTIDAGALLRALPLWVGTVTDVEDLLPPEPGMFDLVILDEASHVDQIRAAPVLLRARRALVAGDPRQLRFVSFVADVNVATTLERYGLAGTAADRLDVRRVSAFDLAASAAPMTWLAEHHRSVPHLIEFSAGRFYGGRIDLVTRHPRNECADVIEVVHVSGADVDDGVNQREVDTVVGLVRDLAGHSTGIGVITPFRAQAEALESALLEAFSLEEIQKLELRVGTVHSFQGSEAPTVIASLGLVDGDAPGRRRFVTDANFFNVMVTRARQRMIVVTSLAGDVDGLLGDFFSYAQRPPVPPALPAAAGWPAAIADELRRAGFVVRSRYPVGRWTVDLCVGDGADAVGLICEVHPDGSAAHLERQRTLRQAGWRLLDAFATRWAADPVRAALDLTGQLGPVSP